MQNGLAPIILFVYNRPDHTLKTLEALQRNKLADQSTLYIFSDGPKADRTDQDFVKIESVRQIIGSKKWCKEVIIKLSDINKGLATSVIEGVTEIINKYGKAIVLEDDLVTSKFFLSYMNEGLCRYENINLVKQISGFIPLKIKTSISHSSFFLPVTTTWGWGSWKRVWNEVDFNPADYKEANKNPEFNLKGRLDYSGMLQTQMESNKISSWGIRFWWDVFKKNGLVLYPDQTLIENIGMDGTGTHVSSKQFRTTIDFDYEIKHYPETISVIPLYYKSFLNYYPKPLWYRRLFK